MVSWRRGTIGAAVLVSLLAVAVTDVGRQAGAGFSVRQAESGCLPGLRPEQRILWDGRHVRLHEETSCTELFTTDEHILKVVWVQPPQGSPQVLILTAEDISTPQPRRSHLYLLDPARPHQARPLSPESNYNFWDMSAGDVDGDGQEEVALCTYSRTARDPHYARRFFVYSWDEHGDLYPRWRGSRLCRPYLWAALADVTGDEKYELVSVEVGLGGGQMLVAYEWNQFGFRGLGHSVEYPALTVLQPSAELPGGGRGVLAVIKRSDGERRQVLLALRENCWEPVWSAPPVPEQSREGDKPQSVSNLIIGRNLQ